MAFNAIGVDVENWRDALNMPEDWWVENRCARIIILDQGEYVFEILPPEGAIERLTKG